MEKEKKVAPSLERIRETLWNLPASSSMNLTVLQLQGPFLSPPSSCLPQDLCSCSSLCLECFSFYCSFSSFLSLSHPLLPQKILPSQNKAATTPAVSSTLALFYYFSILCPLLKWSLLVYLFIASKCMRTGIAIGMHNIICLIILKYFGNVSQSSLGVW